jgi:hypothetical protein
MRDHGQEILAFKLTCPRPIWNFILEYVRPKSWNGDKMPLSRPFIAPHSHFWNRSINLHYGHQLSLTFLQEISKSIFAISGQHESFL